MIKFLQVAVTVLALASAMGVVDGSVCPCSCSDPDGVPFFDGDDEAGVLVTLDGVEGSYCFHERVVEEALKYDVDILACASSCAAADPAAEQEEDSMTQQEAVVEANNNGVCPCSCSDPIGADAGEAGVLVDMSNFGGQPMCLAESMVKEALDFAPGTFSCATSCAAEDTIDAGFMDELLQEVEEELASQQGFEEATAMQMPEFEQQEVCPCSCSEPLGYPGTIAGGGDGVLVTIAGEPYCLDAAMVEGALPYALDILSCVTSCE